MKKPARGEIWIVDLNPTRGHEQAGKRPALIVSVNPFNFGPAELVIVLPITSKDKKNLLHVKIESEESGLKETSFIKCEDIRSVSTERLIVRLGKVNSAVMSAVEDKIRILLGL